LSPWIVCNQGNQYVVRTTNLSSHTVRAQKFAYIDLIVDKLLPGLYGTQKCT